MAAIIFHGPPGSYKTSSAIWFEMLTALRAGRIVVTNIEGMKPIEEIEKELDERFPDSADIWRLSSQNDQGRELWRRFFHWCPIGAQVIIDEVQDVFPNDRTFKPEKYDYKSVYLYEDLLPEKWFKRHVELLDSVKPDDLTKADFDDMNTLLFNEKGHVIYPSTLRESFMRHRKYQWDIVVCTPDITQVHGLIRGACEWGYKHTSKDAIGKAIPYFNRRPRITQHLPKDGGNTPKKSDVGFFRKVPEKVHDLYKSTATGQFNASGRGKTPLTNPAFLFCAFIILFGISYSVYAIGFRTSATEEVIQNSSVMASGQYQESVPLPVSHTASTGSGDTSKITVATIASLGLPNNPRAVELTGVERIKTKLYTTNVHYFRFHTANGSYYMDTNKLKDFGFEVETVSDCRVNIISGDLSFTVYCPVADYQTASSQSLSTRPSVSVF